MNDPQPGDATAATVHAVDAVMQARSSTRAFRPDPVPRQLVEDILRVARTAPSNSNTQPWGVHVLAADAKRRLSDAVEAAFHAGTLPPPDHFPAALPADCAARQDAFGQRYYAALDIDRADAAARARQVARNFHFFGAPVGLIFTIDGQLTRHSWFDCGLFVQNVMLAATARGLATCPQVTFVRFAPVIAEVLQLPPGRAVLCGMSLGYPDRSAEVNRMAMPRDAPERFTTWAGFV